MSATLQALAASLLLTYVLHSTLLLGAAGLLTRLTKRESVRETIWKGALLGALVTTALALAGARPLLLDLAFEVTLAEAPAAAAVRQVPPEPSIPADASRNDGEHAATAPLEAMPGVRDGDASTPFAGDEVAGPERVVVDDRTEPGARSVSWLQVAVIVWLAGAAMLVGRMLVRHARLYQLLHGRREVTEKGLPRMLAELRRTAGVWRPVRLTATSSLATPLVLGRSEICVPQRFLDELSTDEQRAALAHELGHLARRDPAWQLGAMLLECVFFFQPLHRLARRRLRESAEYLADAWAVQHTGSRLGLARCLAEVAGWATPAEEPVLAGTLAMAEGGSPLLLRVKRLLEREPERAPRPALRLGIVLSLLAGGALLGPAIIAGGPASSVLLPHGEAAADVEVIRAPAGMNLPDALSWAAGTARTRGEREYWVAYAIDSAVRTGSHVVIDSEGWEVEELGKPAVGLTLGVVDELQRVSGREPGIVLVRFARDGGTDRITRVALRTPMMGAALEGTVYWLGQPDASRSIGWLQDRLLLEGKPEVRETMIEVVAVHAAPEAARFLTNLIRQAEETHLREEAVEGLAYHPSAEAVALLEGVAREDGDKAVRLEAAETLGEMEYASAGPALRGIVLGQRVGDVEVREEAIEALVERGDAELGSVLLEVALRDPEADARLEAVDVMQELRPGEAMPMLRQIVAESRHADVQAEAIEVMGELGTTEALEALEEALRSSLSEEPALEAVEAITEFSPDQSLPVLERVAETHASSAVRHEAMEAILDLSGSGENRELLLEMAMHADDPGIRADAVERMAELPAAEAVVMLRRVAFESGDETSETEAVEALGEIGTRDALAALDEIIDRNPGEQASVEAVEAMAENFSPELVIPRLRRLIQEHPSSRVREEARDRLSDLDGSS